MDVGGLVEDGVGQAEIGGDGAETGVEVGGPDGEPALEGGGVAVVGPGVAGVAFSAAMNMPLWQSSCHTHTGSGLKHGGNSPWCIVPRVMNTATSVLPLSTLRQPS